jgi:hypothetical protein
MSNGRHEREGASGLATELLSKAIWRIFNDPPVFRIHEKLEYLKIIFAGSQDRVCGRAATVGQNKNGGKNKQVTGNAGRDGNGQKHAHAGNSRVAR